MLDRMCWRTWLAGVVVLAGCTALRASEPIAIGSRLEPLVDEAIIAKMTGVRLELHKPTAREVVIVHDEPWEGNICGYHTVFKDGEIYRMYYRGAKYKLQPGKILHQVTCYAESKDGVTWIKPKLGLKPWAGSTKNNIIWTGEGAHNFAPVKDANPACAPDAKYKALCSMSGGLRALKSSDGVHWSPMSDKPVITKGAFDSQNLAFWDTARGRYAAFYRIFTKGGYKGVRAIATVTSKDFIHWTDLVPLTYPGAPEHHLYTNQIQPYDRAPHILMGFPMRFLPSRRAVQHRYPGVSDVVFMTSRDGVRFKRWDEALVRPGLQKERWVPRNNMIAWGIVPTRSAFTGQFDELSVYCMENYYFNDTDPVRMRRYTIRVDGFVSVNAPYKGGEMVTRPLVFDPPSGKRARPKRAAEPGPIAIDTSKPIRGKRSLIAKAPAVVTLPGTKVLGKKATFAMHVRDLPAGHRRLLSAYNGGPTTPKELYFDVGIKSAPFRLGYDGLEVKAAASLLAVWDRSRDAVHHLAATYDDGVMTLYFDGKRVAQGGKAGHGAMTFALGDLRFAEDYPPTSRVNEPFLGTADDLLVVRRVLSPDEIASLARKGAEAALRMDAEDGVLYTFEGDEGSQITDKLTHDKTQNATLPGPPGPGQVELIINYATSAAGSIRCEVMDAGGKAIPGLTLTDCDEIYGDDIERAVSWQGQCELKQLAGKPVRLRFVMKDADLYSIRFRN